MTTEAEALAPEAETPVIAPETPEAEAPRAEDGDAPETKPDEEAKAKQDGVQKRISELTRARREAERRADAAERQLEAMRTTNTEPTEDQFPDHDAYIRALAKHEAKSAVAETARATSAEAAQTARKEVFQERIADFRSSTPDYDTVIAASEDLQIAGHVGEALMDSEHGAALLYQMAKDNSLAERLNSMSPTRAAMEIGRLEATLAAKPVKPPSNAPAPITPLNATRASPTVDLSKASMPDYIAARNKQGAGFRL